MSDQEGVNPAAMDTVRVLLVEDNEADQLLIRSMLRESGACSFQFVNAATVSAALDRLEDEDVDVILLDLTLSDCRGFNTFETISRRAADIPIIVLSGLDDEELAMRAVNHGAQDYLVKGRVDHVLLLRAVRYAIERKHVERQLRHSDAFYQSLVENLPQKILRKDVNGRFTFVNQRFCAELGIQPDDILGKTDYDFFPPALAAKYQEADRQVMQDGSIYDAVEEHAAGNGDKTYVQVVKTPIYDDLGHIIGTQVIFWDVTEKRLAEDRLKSANQDLARSREELLDTLDELKRSNRQLRETQLQLIEMEKMQTLGQLAAGVAHEVKNPLAILRMGVDSLRGHPDLHDELSETVLEDMSDAIQRADTIIMGLLDFSAHRRVSLEPNDLNALLKRSYRLVQHLFKDPRFEIGFELDADLPEGLLDVNKLNQIFVNILTNASQAMPDGGKITIRTTVRRPTPEDAVNDAREGNRDTVIMRIGTDRLEVVIEDNGPGIPDELLGRICDPFVTTKPPGIGTGLGLSICKKIIELHKGRLVIENCRPHGARFRITLPSYRQPK